MFYWSKGNTRPLPGYGIGLEDQSWSQRSGPLSCFMSSLLLLVLWKLISNFNSISSYTYNYYSSPFISPSQYRHLFASVGNIRLPIPLFSECGQFSLESMIVHLK